MFNDLHHFYDTLQPFRLLPLWASSIVIKCKHSSFWGRLPNLGVKKNIILFIKRRMNISISLILKIKGIDEQFEKRLKVIESIVIKFLPVLLAFHDYYQFKYIFSIQSKILSLTCQSLNFYFFSTSKFLDTLTPHLNLLTFLHTFFIF